MMLNRSVAPELQLPRKADILKPFERKLDNGLSVYVIDSGEENVVKFEIIFPRENFNAETYLQSTACHQLAETGTTSKKAIEIAEAFDYYGAFFQADASPDYVSYSLYSVGSHFENSIKIVDEILHFATFPESEIINWKKRHIQATSVNMEKVSWLAKKAFNETVYGNTHAYGYTPDTSAYERIEKSSVESIYQNGYKTGNSIIILSGKITEQIIESVNRHFGRYSVLINENFGLSGNSFQTTAPKKIRIEKPDNVQAAIRIGRRLFSKNHPDYLPLLIANTILGGYFGSRLMSNIREDKGYTYGIGSGLHSFVRSGSFFIATEVGKGVCEDAVQEIYKEIQKLIDEPVSSTELELVKNYLSGAFLRSLDGPFELAERFKGLRLHDLNYDYFDKYLHLLNKITPQEIMDVAAKHLQPNEMTEVIAG